MNNVSIDVDYMEPLPASTMLRLLDQHNKAKASAVKFIRTVKDCAQMFVQLEAADIEPTFDFRSTSIDLSFTGSGDKLAMVWHLLRANGWTTNSRPKKGDTSYNGFWDAPNDERARVWVQFSSSVCRRVQVGTKMVEQPIYETVCADAISLPEFDSPSTEVTV
jgi:hypothetical protein